MTFTTNFPKHSCFGDSITCDVGSLTITARLEYDQDTDVIDYDCYDEFHRQTFGTRWFYVGVVLDVTLNTAGGSTLIESGVASLWGVEMNILENNDYLMEVANQLLPEALEEAWKTLENIKDTLQEIA